MVLVKGDLIKCSGADSRDVSIGSTGTFSFILSLSLTIKICLLIHSADNRQNPGGGEEDPLSAYLFLPEFFFIWTLGVSKSCADRFNLIRAHDHETS